MDFSLLYSVWFFFLSSLFSFSFCLLWCTMHVIVHVECGSVRVAKVYWAEYMCHKTCKLRPPLDKPAFMAACVFDSCVLCTFRSACRY